MKPETKELIQGCIAIFGGILIHFTFGHFYTIANMVPYIMGYTKARVQPDVSDGLTIWLSALALGVQGVVMPIGGIIAAKIGFRYVVAASCLLESGGVLLTYFTIQKSFIGVIFTYSLIKGAGLGFGYAVVLGVATTWFPQRRGIVSGLIVGGFGLGALIFTPIQTAFINPKNVKVDNVTREFTDPELLDRVPNVFLLLGGLLLGLQIIGFILLRSKPRPAEKEDRHELREEKKRLTGPEHTAGDSETKQTSLRCSTGSLKEPWSKMAPERQPPEDENLTPVQVLRRCDFYRMWVVMFCNIIPITIITSAYKYFGQAYISDDFFLSIVATISAIFNAGGRIMWGAFVDKVSFKIPLCTMLVAWSTILFTFPHLRYLEGSVLKAFYALWVCLLFISLSGVFAIMPTATGTLFGPERMAINYGLVFSAFAFGSVTCSIVNTLVSSKGAYVMQFTACGCVCLIAFFIALSLTDKKMNPRYDVFRSCRNRCNC
ncbi:hypothetical protein CRM22_010237 [Opisthorchis felineus]|uniref:Major facilitator superfamily (MFS) profile domain-containing protein n=1 Tax=Opisthorchis felineus TaxID=147828 RepID=A0A4S2KZY8_OPIFE|nr:hypothetical protein CRM22_010237 [Opisthorchis felineus]